MSGRNAIKNKLLGVKIPASVKDDLQRIAEDIGGLSVSSMIRMLIYSRIEKVKKTGNPKAFLDNGK